MSEAVDCSIDRLVSACHVWVASEAFRAAQNLFVVCNRVAEGRNRGCDGDKLPKSFTSVVL